jgi:hypothetical protein
MIPLPSQPLKTRPGRALLVVACAVLGAAVVFVVIAVQALALLAQTMDLAWLRDVAVNTGPLAVAGGAAAGGAAAGGGAGSGDAYFPGTETVVDPSTGTSREPSLYARILWDIDRRLSGRPTDEERYNQIMGDEHLRSQYREELKSRTDTTPNDPPTEPTTPNSDSPAQPADQAGGGDPPGSTSNPQNPEPPDGTLTGGGGGTIHQKAGTG